MPVAHGGSAIDCPVCMCGVDDAVVLPCSHQYCGPCLDLLLESASAFPIACLAAECGAPLHLSVLRARLSTVQLDALLDKAGKAHIDAHPNEFRFCPTADCAHVYRPGPEGAVLRCSGCLADVCPACHVAAHPGLTCAERREESDPAERAYRSWKRENEVKPCPRCGVDIQKSSGCNHMTCAVCKTHMCWVCMKTFERGGVIYDHMTRAHGGIGV
ncbi:hypothetical protein BV25DRAFT_1220218 [Artomyces pyxidatus]|uniref:Uncharacterized protein n=1 Tax=Artomyces pyxidatus TaxID=48021 RepID=A0ACB8SD61_9AGAM|nr:hypothetical protein BV25DRAFT_1220218 [Artomyces pyxidatus]